MSISLKNVGFITLDLSVTHIFLRKFFMTTKKNLGPELKRMRRDRSMSLLEVSSRVGVSQSFLSQVENGRAQPSVGTLLSLADLFGVPLDSIFRRAAKSEQRDTKSEQRDTKSERSMQIGLDFIGRSAESTEIRLENGVTWTKLADGGGAIASSLLVTYRPGASDTSDGSLKRHSAFEYGYILEGTIELKLDFDVFDLKAGDSFSFDSERPHLFSNRTDKVARGVWFVLHK